MSLRERVTVRAIATAGLILAIVVLIFGTRETERPSPLPSSTIKQRSEAMPSLVAQSEEICRLYSSPGKRRQMADELGAASTSNQDLATAYGQDFEPPWRTHATRYCLQGLTSP